uniref:Putative secreted protein n=1 Tax=Anopheles darlingi TaxID=43151 RepID=A0A2M4D5Q8_ANODA
MPGVPILFALLTVWHHIGCTLCLCVTRRPSIFKVNVKKTPTSVVRTRENLAPSKCACPRARTIDTAARARVRPRRRDRFYVQFHPLPLHP